MKLVEGVYESLISTAIAEKLQRDFPESVYHVEKEQIDSAESHTMLAQYLAEIVSVVLKEYFRDKKEAVTISKQVECVNRILHFIENEWQLDALEDDMLTKEDETNFLRAIYNKTGYSEEQSQADSDDDGIQYGYGEVDYVVPGAVGKSVGGRPEGGSDEDDDGYRNEFHAYVQHFRIFSKEPEDLVGEQEHGSGEKYSYHSHDAEVRNEDPCNSVVLFCSDVLTHHGGSRGVKSICALSGHMVQLGTDARNGRYRDSEGVDIGVDEHL